MTQRRLERPDKPTLAYELFRPAAAPRASVLVTTGLGEHMGRYQDVYLAWQKAGILVCGYDLQGQGDSDGTPGHVNHFDDYVQDALALLDTLAEEPDWSRNQPVFLFGHSLGGLISFHVALSAPSRLKGLLLSSPFFGLAIKPARWQVIAAALLSSVLPTFAQPTTINGNMVTQDPTRARMLDEDPKRIGQVSVRWFSETQRARLNALEKAPQLLVPTFCVASGQDHVADVDSTRVIFDRLRVQHELRIEQNCYHELHQEVDRARIAQLFADRMLTARS